MKVEVISDFRDVACFNVIHHKGEILDVEDARGAKLVSLNLCKAFAKVGRPAKEEKVAPKAEVVKETPKVEPKVEAPKAEPVKVAEPKAEPTKVETKVEEAPKASLFEK